MADKLSVSIRLNDQNMWSIDVEGHDSDTDGKALGSRVSKALRATADGIDAVVQSAAPPQPPTPHSPTQHAPNSLRHPSTRGTGESSGAP